MYNYASSANSSSSSQQPKRRMERSNSGTNFDRSPSGKFRSQQANVITYKKVESNVQLATVKDGRPEYGTFNGKAADSNEADGENNNNNAPDDNAVVEMPIPYYVGDTVTLLSKLKGKDRRNHIHRKEVSLCNRM